MITLPLLMALALLSATAPFATDMHLPVMPEIAAVFGAPESVVQLTLSGFFLGMAVGILVVGPVSDVVGRKRLIVWGAAIALAAAVASAMAPTMEVLILARLIQGMGGGACIVLSRAIIPDIAHGDSAARAFSLLMAIQSIAPAAAPIIGGLLADPVGWRGVYWALVLIHVAQLLLAIFYIPETHAPTGPRKGWGPFFRAVGGNYLYVLKNRRFLVFVVVVAAYFSSMFSYISASPFVLQDVYGFSARTYSLIFAFNALGLMSASIINARVVARVGAVKMLHIGAGIGLAANVTLFLCVVLGLGVWGVLVPLFFCVAPLPMIIGNATALGTGLVREKAGSGSAAISCTQFSIAALVSPLMGLGANPTLTMATGMIICACIGAVATFTATRKLGA